MKSTPEFDQAFGDLEGAAYGLADALQGARSRAEAVSTVDFSRVGDDLERHMRGYLSASERVGTAIAGAAAGAVDEDAVARMSASIGLDLKVAEQLALHARLEGSAESEPAVGVAYAFLTRGARSEDLAAIDQAPSLRSVLSPVLHEIHGNTDLAPSASLAPPSTSKVEAAGAGTPPSVDSAVDKILAAGGTAIAASVSAVVKPDATVIPKLIGKLSGSSASAAAKEAIDRLSQIFHPLARAAAEVLALVIRKIKAIVGSAQLDQLLGDAKEWLVSKWDDLTQENPAGLALGILLAKGDIEHTCAAKLAILAPARADTAVQACDAIASADAKRCGYLGWANSALGFAAGTVVGKTPQGLALLSLVGLALIGCSVWLAQDSLDAERLSFLPNHILGIRGTVLAA